jgi:hypothetical protein
VFVVGVVGILFVVGIGIAVGIVEGIGGIVIVVLVGVVAAVVFVVLVVIGIMPVVVAILCPQLQVLLIYKPTVQVKYLATPKIKQGCEMHQHFTPLGFMSPAPCERSLSCLSVAAT